MIPRKKTYSRAYVNRLLNRICKLEYAAEQAKERNSSYVPWVDPPDEPRDLQCD